MVPVLQTRDIDRDQRELPSHCKMSMTICEMLQNTKKGDIPSLTNSNILFTHFYCYFLKHLLCSRNCLIKITCEATSCIYPYAYCFVQNKTPMTGINLIPFWLQTTKYPGEAFCLFPLNSCLKH